jgi:hypothetical protein
MARAIGCGLRLAAHPNAASPHTSRRDREHVLRKILLINIKKQLSRRKFQEAVN